MLFLLAIDCMWLLQDSFTKCPVLRLAYGA